MKLPKRAHSKNENYQNTDGSLLEEESLDMPQHYATHNGSNFVHPNQRFIKNQYQGFPQMNGESKTQDMRPSSATLKRLEGSKRSEDL